MARATVAQRARRAQRAEALGATITRPAAETFYGGYAGCFTDPDGHAWEIAHNPGFKDATALLAFVEERKFDSSFFV